MVPFWMALAAWLVCWTAMALISQRLLARARPGEKAPMQWDRHGRPTWRLPAPAAAAFMPVLSLVLGAVTLSMSARTGGAAPVLNLLIAGGLVALHAVHIHIAVRILEHERGEHGG